MANEEIEPNLSISYDPSMAAASDGGFYICRVTQTPDDVLVSKYNSAHQFEEDGIASAQTASPYAPRCIELQDGNLFVVWENVVS